jgi:hypothetical protein
MAERRCFRSISEFADYFQIFFEFRNPSKFFAHDPLSSAGRIVIRSYYVTNIGA